MEDIGHSTVLCGECSQPSITSQRVLLDSSADNVGSFLLPSVGTVLPTVDGSSLMLAVGVGLSVWPAVLAKVY